MFDDSLRHPVNVFGREYDADYMFVPLLDASAVSFSVYLPVISPTTRHLVTAKSSRLDIYDINCATPTTPCATIPLFLPIVGMFGIAPGASDNSQLYKIAVLLRHRRSQSIHLVIINFNSTSGQFRPELIPPIAFSDPSAQPPVFCTNSTGHYAAFCDNPNMLVVFKLTADHKLVNEPYRLALPSLGIINMCFVDLNPASTTPHIAVISRHPRGGRVLHLCALDLSAGFVRVVSSLRCRDPTTAFVRYYEFGLLIIGTQGCAAVSLPDLRAVWHSFEALTLVTAVSDVWRDDRDDRDDRFLIGTETGHLHVLAVNNHNVTNQTANNDIVDTANIIQNTSPRQLRKRIRSAFPSASVPTSDSAPVSASTPVSVPPFRPEIRLIPAGRATVPSTLTNVSESSETPRFFAGSHLHNSCLLSLPKGFTPQIYAEFPGIPAVLDVAIDFNRSLHALTVYAACGGFFSGSVRRIESGLPVRETPISSVAGITGNGKSIVALSREIVLFVDADEAQPVLLVSLKSGAVEVLKRENGEAVEGFVAAVAVIKEAEGSEGSGNDTNASVTDTTATTAIVVNKKEMFVVNLPFQSTETDVEMTDGTNAEITEITDTHKSATATATASASASTWHIRLPLVDPTDYATNAVFHGKFAAVHVASETASAIHIYELRNPASPVLLASVSGADFVSTFDFVATPSDTAGVDFVIAAVPWTAATVKIATVCINNSTKSVTDTNDTGDTTATFRWSDVRTDTPRDTAEFATAIKCVFSDIDNSIDVFVGTDTGILRVFGIQLTPDVPEAFPWLQTSHFTQISKGPVAIISEVMPTSSPVFLVTCNDTAVRVYRGRSSVRHWNLSRICGNIVKNLCIVDINSVIRDLPIDCRNSIPCRDYTITCIGFRDTNLVSVEIGSKTAVSVITWAYDGLVRKVLKIPGLPFVIAVGLQTCTGLGSELQSEIVVLNSTNLSEFSKLSLPVGDEVTAICDTAYDGNEGTHATELFGGYMKERAEAEADELLKRIVIVAGFSTNSENYDNDSDTNNSEFFATNSKSGKNPGFIRALIINTDGSIRICGEFRFPSAVNAVANIGGQMIAVGISTFVHIIAIDLSQFTKSGNVAFKTVAQPYSTQYPITDLSVLDRGIFVGTSGSEFVICLLSDTEGSETVDLLYKYSDYKLRNSVTTKLNGTTIVQDSESDCIAVIGYREILCTSDDGDIVVVVQGEKARYARDGRNNPFFDLRGETRSVGCCLNERINVVRRLQPEDDFYRLEDIPVAVLGTASGGLWICHDNKKSSLAVHAYFRATTIKQLDFPNEIETFEQLVRKKFIKDQQRMTICPRINGAYDARAVLEYHRMSCEPSKRYKMPIKPVETPVEETVGTKESAEKVVKNSSNETSNRYKSNNTQQNLPQNSEIPPTEDSIDADNYAGNEPSITGNFNNISASASASEESDSIYSLPSSEAEEIAEPVVLTEYSQMVLAHILQEPLTKNLFFTDSRETCDGDDRMRG